MEGRERVGSSPSGSPTALLPPWQEYPPLHVSKRSQDPTPSYPHPPPLHGGWFPTQPDHGPRETPPHQWPRETPRCGQKLAPESLPVRG